MNIHLDLICKSNPVKENIIAVSRLESHPVCVSNVALETTGCK